MGVKAELADFLNHLPAVDGPAERKALLTFTGPAELGIYLDWQGANVAFTERLLEELSRRGKGALLGFLAGLPNAPQVANSVERQDRLAGLRARVEALDEAGFRAQFPVPAAAAGPRPPADPAMLAAATLNDVLAPYYKLGPDGLRQQAGPRAAALAERLSPRVEAALAGDPEGRAYWTIFRRAPEAAQAELLGVLKARLGSDPALAASLANLFASAAAEPEQGGLGALLRVRQKMGLVKGDVVGAVVGTDALDKIQRVSVTQTIDTVARGATVTGAVAGGGPVTIGGEHHYGGDVNTGGGGYVGGGLKVGRDYVGRDQVVYGHPTGPRGADLASIFRAANAQIERRAEDPEVDKDELRATANRLRNEVAKGGAANAAKVERWLRQLLDTAPDVAEGILAGLADPAAGAAAAIARLARQVRGRG